MKNRPLPPPPPPPRKKPSGYSSPSLETERIAPEPPIVTPIQVAAESTPAPVAAETAVRESPPPRPATPPPPPLAVEEGGISPACSDPELSSQATDAPSEITLRSDGSQATLTSGRDPGL